MRKVLPGQPLKIPASTYNTMVDAAAEFQRSRLNRGGEAVRPIGQTGIVTIRNSCGADRDRFEVLGLSSVLVTPTLNVSEFASRFCFDAVMPDSAHAKRFVVLQEPIAIGAFGKAMLVGITPVMIKRITSVSSRVGIETGQPNLKTGVLGAQILWEDPDYTGDELHLAVVRLPADCGGPVTACRFVVTDADQLLSGLGDIDGETPSAGDMALRAADDDLDGVWEVSSGAWKKLFGLTDFEKGDAVAIWGGKSAPKLYVRMVADVGAV